MIHGILEDDHGMLWLSTNKGLIKFNPVNEFSHAYYYSGGIQTGEFSDDAYYRCPYSGKLFFGGIDGLAGIAGDVAEDTGYFPDILLRKLFIGKQQTNLQDFYAGDGRILSMRGKKLSFTLSFVVPDYSSGNDADYSYMLEGYDKEWIPFSTRNTASYYGVSPGEYLLRIRYKKDVSSSSCKQFSLPVRILPPWYLSVWACLAYVLAGFLLLAYAALLLKRYFRHEKLLKQLQSSERLNASLQAVGYRERETLNCCTMVFRHCGLLDDKDLSPGAKAESVMQIREAVMSLLFGNRMGEECFRMLSSLHYFVSGRFCLSHLEQEVRQVLEQEGHSLSHVRTDISEGFTFPLYKNAMLCILYFCGLCLSRRPVPVTVSAGEKEDKMQITFSGPDSVLGELYRLLQDGDMDMEAKDTDDSFRMTAMRHFALSALRQQQCSLDYVSGNEGRGLSAVLSLTFEPIVVAVPATEKKTVLLLEDRAEMTWLVSALLSDEYEVRAVQNIQQAFDEMRQCVPVLFMVDMLMYVNAESTFLKFIGKHRSLLSKTAFVPLLTWKVSASTLREMILWSDSYLMLPYDIPFLKEVVHKVVYGKREAEQIETGFMDGWGGTISCSTEEQAAFIRRFRHIVEQNLDNEELTTAFIAGQMNLSTRQFYRRIKDISGMSPGDLIRNYRMEKAAYLLREEQDLSISEVMDRVGISSRSYFYKEFTRKFNLTPKEYKEQTPSAD